VTYGIIKDHGGDIRVESDPGQGATFIITIPVWTGAAHPTDTGSREAGKGMQAGEGDPDPANEPT